MLMLMKKRKRVPQAWPLSHVHLNSLSFPTQFLHDPYAACLVPRVTFLFWAQSQKALLGSRTLELRQGYQCFSFCATMSESGQTPEPFSWQNSVQPVQPEKLDTDPGSVSVCAYKSYL